MSEVREIPSSIENPEIEKQVKSLEEFKHDVDLLNKVNVIREEAEKKHGEVTTLVRLDKLSITLNGIRFSAIQEFDEIIDPEAHRVFIVSYTCKMNNQSGKSMFDCLRSIKNDELHLVIENPEQHYIVNYQVKIVTAERNMRTQDAFPGERFVFEVVSE